MAASNNPEDLTDEVIDDDDLCPICHLLYYAPVTTTCGHTLCASCMAHWAEVSVTEQFEIVPLDDQSTPVTEDQIEVKCPMCRTVTWASPNQERGDTLGERYPRTYKMRKSEEEEDQNGNPAEEVLTMTLYVGNTHQYKPPQGRDNEQDGNTHEWDFFVRPDKTDIIDEVRIILVCPTSIFTA
jgi:RING finger family protein